MKKLYLSLVAVVLALPPVVCIADDKPQDVDWDKARQLHQREQKGEKLSSEEQAYLDHAKKVRGQSGGPAGNAAKGKQGGPEAPAPRESTGLVPLTQMTGEGKYKGQTGGLYGDGSNTPPEKLMAAAKAAAAQVQPLGADGKPSPDGKIVLVSMGMSNTTMEFSAFAEIANRDPEKSTKVQIVDLAQGGQDAVKWKETGAGSPWEKAEQRLKSARVTDAQVQVVWLKQALVAQGRFGEFPKHSDQLKADIQQNIKLARERFPNLKLVYLSSRIYAGYATTALNPEPYAYEGAFAVRGVILDQLNGELGRGPVALWGPYLWADGIKGRTGDDLVWKREDLTDKDGTHPSNSGRQKVAAMLLKFLKTDETAKGWFTKG